MGVLRASERLAPMAVIGTDEGTDDGPPPDRLRILYIKIPTSSSIGMLKTYLYYGPVGCYIM
jgi:hypothetical protein